MTPLPHDPDRWRDALRAEAPGDDWTWVLERACPQCGLDVPGLDIARIGDVLRSNAMAWADLLEVDDRRLRTRPRPERWSRLEYACHVRDVYRLFDRRLQRMLSEDDSSFPDWDQDAAAVEGDYRSQDPRQVAAQLLDAADGFADRLDGVHGGQWERTATRSDGFRFSVDSLARYFIHDPVHHIWDVTTALEAR